MISKFCLLSEIDPDFSYEQVIDYLLDNRYIGILNDNTGVEYELVDLRDVWHNLKKIRQKVL